MTASERESFLEQRSHGLGGSDIASLLQPLLPDDVKYGCRRRLWYDKSRVPADYPQDDTGPMQLGRILEPHIARWHAEASGDRLSEPGLVKHVDHPELLVNIDRIVENDDHDTPGVGEIKALGPDMFWQVKRDGILVDYLLQIQHGMLCKGLDWGKFIVGNRAYGHSIKNPPLAWEQQKDADIHDAILSEGPAFWRTLRDESKSPDRLEPDDKRCSSCEWRRTCQGNALIHNAGNKDDLPFAEDIRPLLIEYDAVNSKFCEKLPDGSKGTADDLRLAEIKEEIRAVLAAREAVAVSQPNGGKARKVYFRWTDGRVSWETAAMVAAYEKLRLDRRREAVAHAAFNPHDTTALNQFDSDFPAAETFKRQGNPFRALRIF